ncbi:MAG TPA: hypothetical protein VGM53_34885 [Streptosporangiaceae bacterium]
MSLRTTKEQAQAQASAGIDRARQAATQARMRRPAAKEAAAGAAARLAPLARNAGTAATQAGAAATQGVHDASEWARPRITQSVHDARDWATPRIAQGMHDAREWAAPRIEQAGNVISDTVAPRVTGVISETVAPKVNDVMTATARRIEPAGQAVKRRLWPRVLAGLAVASALGSVIAIALRRRSAQLTDDIMDDDVAEAPAKAQEDNEEVIVEAEVGANGSGPTP